MKNYFYLSALLLSASVFATAATVPATSDAPAQARQNAPTVYITLRQAQDDAQQNSPALKEALAQASAAKAQYKSVQSGLYPALTFDAKGTYVSQVPSLQVGPQSMEFGDKWGYNIGPTLNYTLFDYGATEKQARAAAAALESKQAQAQFTRKTVMLQTRQAYFAIQQDLQHIFYAQEQLKTAQKQMQDINYAYKAGTKSALDVNMAQKQQLKMMSAISAARGALGGHLRELTRLTGNDYGINAAYPQDARAPFTPDATAYVKAEDLQDTLAQLNAFEGYNFDDNSPSLAALTGSARYYQYLALSYSAALAPRVTLNGGVYWEYPNGPLHEDIINGRAGVNLRIPIFEAGKSKQAAAAQQSQSEAALYQKQDLEAEVSSLFYSSKSLLIALNAQEELTKKIIDTCAKNAALTYDAYKAGSVTFLEVDNANLNLLEAQTALADIYAKRLNSLAVMDNLGRGK